MIPFFFFSQYDIQIVDTVLILSHDGSYVAGHLLNILLGLDVTFTCWVHTELLKKDMRSDSANTFYDLNLWKQNVDTNVHFDNTP